MAKKIQVLELQSVIQPFNVEEAPYYIPWLSEDPEAISFIQVKVSPPDNTFTAMANSDENSKDLTMILAS